MRALVVTLMVVTACGGAARQTETLSESIRLFNDGVRWQRFGVAANQIPPPERAAFVDEMDERASDLRITDYEVVKVDSQGPNEAKVQVKLSWYLDSEGTLRETHAIQTWELHGKAWWMVDAARLRGPSMPGLAEPRPRDGEPDDAGASAAPASP